MARIDDAPNAQAGRPRTGARRNGARGRAQFPAMDRHRVTTPHPPGLAPVLERNMRALIARRRAEDARKSPADRIADRVTAFSGSMRFVWIHLALFGTWIAWNLPFSPLPRFDPSLVVLAMAASVEAIFLSTFVLISQNRMAALAEKRAELDLQISLLSEHEVTRLIRMVRAIGDKLGLEESKDSDLHDLAEDVAPEEVLDHLEHVERAVDREDAGKGAP
jgi:uncharacterized membrane protein